MDFICDGNNKYTVVVDNKPYHFGPDHDEYANLVDALKVKDEEEFIQLITVGQQLADWTSGDFNFVDGVMTYQGEEVHTVIADRMVRLMKNGFSCHPMMEFVENLYENPSFRYYRRWSLHRLQGSGSTCGRRFSRQEDWRSYY